MNNKTDFPMLNQEIIYFDNGATTFKPQCVIDKTIEYYSKYSANAHRGDYDISYKVDLEYEDSRDIIAQFINAKYREEIIFTSGTTQSINMIANGFFKNLLEAGDEILITKSEHASNVLPWFKLALTNGCTVNYIPLEKDYKLSLEAVKLAITPNTKLISLAQVTNVIGDVRPIKQIVEYAHAHNIFVIVDGAQSVGHMKVDVQDLGCDFLAFSAHKMCGPTGVGILYGIKKLLENLEPTDLGGGMNESFDTIDSIKLKPLPERLEAGTPNIAGAIAFKEAIKYLEKIGMNEIHEYELELHDYLLEKMLKIPHLDIINPDSHSGIIAFNVEGIFAQDVAYYLNKYGICVRAGNHCAKILKQETSTPNVVRISLYFYNDKKEIDSLIELLSDYKRIEKEMI